MHSCEGFGYSIMYSEHFILVSSFRFRSIVIATTLKITSKSAEYVHTHKGCAHRCMKVDFKKRCCTQYKSTLHYTRVTLIYNLAKLYRAKSVCVWYLLIFVPLRQSLHEMSWPNA